MILSPNTQAILLLTAPLIAGRHESSSDLLTPSEYKQLARNLRDQQREPAELLSQEADALCAECLHFIETARLKRLLARGFLLSQAIERWQTRAIWVISLADAEYPRRLKARLKEDAPPLLYGCGDITILETGGLAVVGSRNVDDALIEYTVGIGRLVAQARRTLVSGGARGIDQAAMRGALEAGGKLVGVLADSLERAALVRDHREVLMDRRLVLISPYDPAAGFNVGHAMQRNKLIYALSDAALAVNSDYEKGGTWTGAVEQLERLRLVPVYVRSNGTTSKGLDALRRKGALPWPNPETPEALEKVLAIEAGPKMYAHSQDDLFSRICEEPKQVYENLPISVQIEGSLTPQTLESPLSPDEESFAKVRKFFETMTTPKTAEEVANEFQVSKKQAKEWLRRLIDEGVIEKLFRPVRYRSVTGQASLFDRKD